MQKIKKIKITSHLLTYPYSPSYVDIEVASEFHRSITSLLKDENMCS